MRITFKRKQYKTYEILPDEIPLVQKMVKQEGLEGFVQTVLASEVIATEFEDEWELLEADKDFLQGIREGKK